MPAIILYTFKNYAIIAGVALIVPLAYAASQATPALTANASIEGTASSLLATSTRLTANIPELADTEGGPVLLTYGTIEKVKKGKVENLDPVTNSFTIETGKDTLMLVRYNASTTLYTGTGLAATLDDVEEGEFVYIFGFLRSDNQAMIAVKIVTANKSKLERMR